MRFLDANVFLRYLVEGDEAKQRACLALLQRLGNGEEVGVTSESVVAEVAYVLRARAHYGLTPSEIASRLRPVLTLRGLKLANKQSFLRALELWEGHPALDFEDVLSLAHMERMHITEVYTYDRDFDGLPGVARLEPSP